MANEAKQATARPWRIEPMQETHGETTAIVGTGSSVVLATIEAQVWEDEPPIDDLQRVEDWHNARLIVRAVNTFDKAREALRAAADVLEAVGHEASCAEDCDHRTSGTTLACSEGCPVGDSLFAAEEARAVLAEMDGEEGRGG